MPSHKVHIKIAQDINKKLKLDNDSIMLGSVLPDLTTTKNHGLSHFQYKDEYPYNLANADEFIKKYPNMNDDVSIGYIIHLLTDRFYYDWYYRNFKLTGTNKTKEFKHSLFESYDNYILKHYKLDKFNNTEVINKIPNYQDLEVDRKYLVDYIDRFNNEIDNSKIDNNYTIDNLNLLNQLYNDCLSFILNFLEERN